MDIASKKNNTSYTIRFVKLTEHKKLVNFINRIWKKNHVFVKNKKLLDWQHKGLKNYTFVVAINNNLEFHALLGFISSGFYYNRDVLVGDDIWLCIWVVDKINSSNNSIGLDVYNYLVKTIKPSSICGAGLNKKVSYLYKLMGFNTGEMKHYFLLNTKLKKFKIAENCNKFQNTIEVNYKENVFVQQESWDLKETSKKYFIKESPKKNFNFVKSRYSNHPKYKYKLLSIINEKNGKQKILAFLVTREIIILEAKIIRIVDLFNHTKLDYYFYFALKNFIECEGAEYIDILTNKDISKELKKINFQENSENNFVPNHFEPFDKKNKKIIFGIKSDKEYVIFKGDVDTDRPNF